MKKSNPEDVRARRAQALRTSIATLSELLAELEQDTTDAPTAAIKRLPVAVNRHSRKGP